jgi:hypothetical protein
MALAFAGFLVVGCQLKSVIGPDATGSQIILPDGASSDTTPPTYSSSSPSDGATGVAINRKVIVTFSEVMLPVTLNTSTFLVKQGTTSVAGNVSCVGAVATFSPTSYLASNSLFTVTITTGVKDIAVNGMAADKSWSFTTGATAAMGPGPVNLGVAGDFVILSKSGVSSVPASIITGNVGVSPAAATYITGFALSLDASTTFSTSTQVTGKLYAADYTPPTPAYLTTAVYNMETAHVDAAGRPTPDFTELGAGNISGLTLVPGLYKWGTGVLIASDVTLSGGPNDVWIFQIGKDLTIENGKKVILSGGALPKNIFWKVVACTAGTGSHLEGIVMASTAINLSTGASINGRLLAQTAITLQSSTVTAP